MTGFKNLIYLYLSFNNLSTLDANLFVDLNLLKSLELTNNKISVLHDGCFNGLANLTELNLSYNNLTQIISRFFYGLEKLSNLNLDGNYISFLVNETFTNLPSLSTLSIKHNNLLNVDGLIFARNLALDFSCNQLTFINTNRITAENIALLNISNNQFKLFDSVTLNNLHSLEALDLRSNPFVDIKTHAMVNLSIISWLNFANLSLNSSSANLLLQEITADQLYSLDLSQNLLDNIGSWIGTKFPSLRVFYASNNRVTSIDLDNFTNLYSLDLSNNLLTSINSTTFKGLTQLRNLVLRNNSLTVLEKNSFNGLNLQLLDLNGNRIKEIQKLAFNGFIGQSFHVNLGNNQLRYINERTFRGINFTYKFFQFFRIDLNGNQIEEIGPNTFREFGSNLTYLDLTSNKLNWLDNTTFLMLTNLQGLGLSGNPRNFSNNLNLCKVCYIF